MNYYNFYLLKYNNYYNREVKKFDSLSDYIDYVVTDVVSGIKNWTPGDGVDSVQIINNVSTNWLGEPDYLVITDDNDNIISRWFIMEVEQIRGGQLKLKLHRDVVADYYESVLDSPCFVEKAILKGSNDLIFNSENMTFNQIKKKEILLKDESDTPWIVGYISRKIQTKQGSITLGSNYDISMSDTAHTDFEFYDNRSVANAIRYTPENIKIAMNVCRTLSTSPVTRMQIKFFFDNFGAKEQSEPISSLNGFVLTLTEMSRVFKSDYPSWFNMDDIRSDLANKFNYSSSNDVDTLIRYSGKRIQFSDGIYRIIVKEANYSATSTITVDDGAIYSNDLYPKAVNGIMEITEDAPGGIGPYFEATVTGKSYYIEMIKLTDDGEQFDWEIPAARNKLTDAPYDMFAIPMNSIFFGVIPGGTTYRQLEDVGKIVASSIGVELSAGASGELYDIQIVPYCPFPNAIQSSNTISTLNLVEHTDYEYIKDGDGNPVGIMLFPNESSFNNVIGLSLSDRIIIEDYKVECECDLYRLCSPNYTGVFEFNAAKNDGVTYFEVNCTYKPYNPYIQLNPNFKRLYGRDFNDERGLICGGDFSMAIVNDAWVTYELNNKNYEKSFQRNITSLELQNKYATIRDVSGAVSGSIGAGISTGEMAGPVAGVAAGVLSAGAGAADVYMNTKLRRENINLQKDQFSYSLQNIRALPLTLSRTTSYTINNKYFPFLEYYSCSDVEKEAFRNKIKYEGMTVMTIGTIRDYVTNEMQFIKGRMIKIIGDDYYADTHISEEINSRVSQGIYIGG